MCGADGEQCSARAALSWACITAEPCGMAQMAAQGQSPTERKARAVAKSPEVSGGLN